MLPRRQATFAGSGVALAGDIAGPEDGRTILFLHGAGQTRHSWSRAVDEAARRGFRAVALDLRGHGDSGWSPEGRYALDMFVDDLRAVLPALGAPPILVGASMGGSIGMIAAAGRDPPLAALVLVDIAARVDVEAAEEIMAFMGSAREGFTSIDEAADAVAAYLPHRSRPSSSKGLARNLRLRDGRYHWHWDPAFLTIAESQPDARPLALDDAARRLALPTLLIRGGRSRIVTQDNAEAFRALVPHAEYVDVANADHMVAGDDNDAFNAAVFDFIDRLPPA